MSQGIVRLRIALWDAINRYAETCGGDTSARTVSREREAAVVDIERVVGDIERAAGTSALNDTWTFMFLCRQHYDERASTPIKFVCPECEPKQESNHE